MNKSTRRDFLQMIGAFGALNAFGEPLLMPTGEGNYEVVILGDTHFDTEPDTVYHAAYKEKNPRLSNIQRSEFARNGEMWRERCPRLLARAAANITASTAFVLQTGDLIQGDCGNGDTHKRMLDDAMNLIKRKIGNLPLVTVTGNHDIRGVGAERAYSEYMPARLTKELGRPVTSRDFYFWQGPDAWIVVDFNHSNRAHLDQMLDETASARHTFIVSHGPLIPSDIRSVRWMFMGGADAKSTEARAHFRKRLAKRHAIVLAGHIHYMELMDWQSEDGTITQFVMNSVWSEPKLANIEWRSQGVENYGKIHNAGGNALIDEYAQGMKRYFSAFAAGSYRLKVEPKRVAVEFYGGEAASPTDSWTLKG